MNLGTGKLRRVTVFLVATLCAIGLAIASQYQVRIAPHEPAEADRQQSSPYLAAGELKAESTLSEPYGRSNAPSPDLAAKATIGPVPYPPPYGWPPTSIATITTTPTASPTPHIVPSAIAGPAGYLPAPDTIDYQVTSLSASPHADLLIPLQASFSGADAGHIASMLAEDRGGMSLIGPAALDSEAGDLFGQARFTTLLEGIFASGARPLIQGYFIDPSQTPACVEVLGHAMPASLPIPEVIATAVPVIPAIATDSASIPTARATGNPVPAASALPIASPPSTSVAGTYGGKRADHLSGDAAMMRFCADGQGDWLLTRWVDGFYSQLIAQAAGAEPSPGRIYHLIR